MALDIVQNNCRRAVNINIKTFIAWQPFAGTPLNLCTLTVGASPPRVSKHEEGSIRAAGERVETTVTDDPVRSPVIPGLMNHVSEDLQWRRSVRQYGAAST